MTFSINKKSILFIYGISDIGIKIYNKMLEAGFNVNGFLDKRGDEFSDILIGNKKVPVYVINNKVISSLNKKNIIIIMAIRNPFVQNKVVELLNEKKYEKIIFLPVIIDKDNIWIDMMRKVYLSLESNVIKKSDLKNIPYSKLVKESSKFIDYSLISITREFCIVNVPIALIYMSKQSFYEDLNNNNYRLNRRHNYCDKNIVALDMFYDMFNFFENGRGNIDLYLKKIQETCPDLFLQKESDIKQQKWLDDRNSCFCLLSEAFNVENDFFIKSAIPAAWNEKGYFNLLDGHHRAAFLYFKGFNNIALKILKSDYDKWINNKVAKKCIAYMKKNNFKSLSTPIHHPYFVKMRADREVYGKTILATLQEHIGLNDISELTFLDVNPSIGYFSQNISRYGAKVIALQEFQENYKFMCLLNLLSYQKNVFTINQSLLDYNPKKVFDCTLSFGMFADDQNKNLEILKKINYITKNILIWETSAYIQDEIKFIRENSQFKYYKSLRKTFKNKQICELGIFSKNGCFEIKKY